MKERGRREKRPGKKRGGRRRERGGDVCKTPPYACNSLSWRLRNGAYEDLSLSRLNGPVCVCVTQPCVFVRVTCYAYTIWSLSVSASLSRNAYSRKSLSGCRNGSTVECVFQMCVRVCSGKVLRANGFKYKAEHTQELVHRKLH